MTNINQLNKEKYEQLMLNNIASGIPEPLAATISKIVKDSIMARDYIIYEKFDSVSDIRSYDVVAMFSIANDDPLFGMFFNVDEPRLVVGTNKGVVNIDL
jgi:hypothetical protein